MWNQDCMIIVWMIVDLHPFTTVVIGYYGLFFVHQGTRVPKKNSSRHGKATKAKRISCPSCIPRCIRLTHNSDQNGLPQTSRQPMSQTSRQPMFFLSQGLCTLLPTCFFMFFQYMYIFSLNWVGRLLWTFLSVYVSW